MSLCLAGIHPGQSTRRRRFGKHRAGRLDTPELIERIADLTCVIGVVGRGVEISEAHERAMADEAPFHLCNHGGDSLAGKAIEFVVGALLIPLPAREGRLPHLSHSEMCGWHGTSDDQVDAEVTAGLRKQWQ